MTEQDTEDEHTEQETPEQGQEETANQETHHDETTADSATEFLSEIAEAPEEDVDEVLADIVAEDADDTDTDTDSTADPAEMVVDDDLVAELESMQTEQLARTVAVLRAEVDRLDTELADTRAEADDLESRLARKQADFQNYKKRQKKRLEEEKQRATEDFVTRLLDVRDNLERALEQDEDTDIRSGVESTLDQFDQQLERENVEPIEPEVGAETDPRRHEVLATIASDQPEDTVAQVHRPGYVMGEKVLRPAQVAVSDGSLDEQAGSE
ncbi:molecular chaperone GrpE [Halovenus aranensis]|jgi:molecular chaperone GrpE|uniref:Protein GrpE n=1 Tax=Halovenus aranensis TaxID=890420 RepID=A0A1G8U5F9_9EURY|nr:nucleotide exchange factor GrpE [Halovenus aranensis]SDJ48864.1 molecular chaperone GrpE [Halovenus aranensis]